MNFIDTFFNTHKPRTITLEGEEKQCVVGGKGKTALILRMDNDSLAQDDGILKSTILKQKLLHSEIPVT